MITRIYLIRHAKAGNRHRWTDPDHLRPLTKVGRRQAEALVETLRGHDLSALVSSPYARCMQTLEPLAADRGLPVTQADELVEGADVHRALALMLELGAQGPAAVCTHGDVMQLGVIELAEAGVPLTGGGALDAAKGSTWVLEVAAGSVTRARYVPPPRV